MKVPNRDCAPLEPLCQGVLLAAALGSPPMDPRDSSRKLGTQTGRLHDPVLAPGRRKEIPLRLYLQIFALDTAEAHHAPIVTMTCRTIAREQTVDARFDVHGLGQLSFDIR